MKRFLNNKKYLSIILFLSALIPLSAAYISEYFFGLKPCQLCIYQRIPFFVILAATSLFIVFRLSSKYLICLVSLCLLAYLSNTAIAFFHVGVEFKWWRFGECSANLNTSSFEAFKQAILAAPSIRCDEPQFKFIGISMAGWNFILNIFYAVFAILIIKKMSSYARKYRKNDKS